MTMTSVSKQSLAMLLLGAAILLARTSDATNLAFDDVARDLRGKGKGGSSKSSEKVCIK